MQSGLKVLSETYLNEVAPKCIKTHESAQREKYLNKNAQTET